MGNTKVMSSSLDSVKIIRVPRTLPSLQSYIQSYKSFRLLALKTSPEAFGSTYEREIAFADEVWLERLQNPLATTFVIINDETTMEENEDAERRDERSKELTILSTLTVLGPMDVDPLTIKGTNPWAVLGTNQAEIRPSASRLQFKINGIFTHPSARKRGLSKMLIKKAIEFTEELASDLSQKHDEVEGSEDTRPIVSISVDQDNIPAKRLYEACGFEVVDVVNINANAPEEEARRKERWVCTMSYSHASKSSR